MKELSNVLVGFFREHPWLVSVNLAFSLLVPIQDVVLPHFYGKIVGRIESKRALVFPFVVALVLLVVVQVGFSLGDWHDGIVGPKMQAYVRKAMINKVFETLENNNTEISMGDMMSRIVKLPEHIVDWFDKIKNYMVPYGITYMITIMYFMYYDLLLGSALLVLTGAFFYGVMLAPWRYMKRASLKDDALNTLHEEIDDTLRNITSVFGKGQAQQELDRLEQYEKLYTDANMQIVGSAVKTRLLALSTLVLFLMVFVIRFTSNRGRVKTSIFVSMFIMLLYVLSSMTQLADFVREMILDAGVLASFESFFAFKGGHATAGESTGPDRNNGIYIENLSFRYPNTKEPVIRGLSLYIRRGERVAIVGDIGSGKSTLLRILMRFQEPSSGRIYINGLPYNSIPVKELRRRIGYIPQQPVLFNRSIIDNILYGNERVPRSYVEALILRLGLDREFANLNRGLDTRVGKNGSNISGGQRQLVWCLRVLLNNPEIVLLDEPTASLDEKTKTVMKGLFDMFMTNRTVLMVTHDKTLVDYASRIVNVSVSRS